MFTPDQMKQLRELEVVANNNRAESDMTPEDIVAIAQCCSTIMCAVEAMVKLKQHKANALRETFNNLLLPKKSRQ